MQVHVIRQVEIIEADVALALHRHGRVGIAAADQVPVYHHEQILLALALDLVLLDSRVALVFLFHQHFKEKV